MKLVLFRIPKDILAMNTGVVFTKFLMIKKAFFLVPSEKLTTGGTGVVLFLVQPEAVVPEDVFIELSLLEETSTAVIEDAGKLMLL